MLSLYQHHYHTDCNSKIATRCAVHTLEEQEAPVGFESFSIAEACASYPTLFKASFSSLEVTSAVLETLADAETLSVAKANAKIAVAA